MGAIVLRRDVWTRIVDEGLINTVSLHPPADRLPTAEAFWLGPGSFAVPLIALGALVIRQARRSDRIPPTLGLGVTAWAIVVGLLGGFDAGAVTLVLIGVLLLAGNLPARGR